MRIFASIGGYGGTSAEPVTLLAHRDEAAGELVILEKVPYQESADTKEDAFVTNMRLANYDCLFTEEHLNGAIHAYKEAEGMGTLILDDPVARYRPRIEVDGIDPHGQKYRLHQNITNEEIAVLALVHFTSRQRSITATLSLSDRIANLYKIVSI